VLREPFRRLGKAFGSRGTANTSRSDFLWALKDVSLEVRAGEVLGIIGRNGTGKSTLLKILSRITRPTEGEAVIHGRTGSLLEVGTGFHPELTGRENIYLNGAILGMSRADIDRKFDEIVEFSECGRFLDTSVKHYSSGMYMRLAFAVAAHLETEILLVDEVLAVGDAAFQKKCLGKMGEVAHQGRTILFVSHNLLAVDSLCSNVICLNEGRVMLQGPARQVTSRYLKECVKSSGLTEVRFDEIEIAPGNDQIRLHRACVRPLNGSAADRITVRTPFVVEFEYWVLVAPVSVELSVNVYDGYETLLFCTWSAGGRSAGLLRSAFVVPGDLLNTGRHRIHLGVYLGRSTEALNLGDSLLFEVQDAADFRGLYHGDWPGVVRPHLEWKTEQLGPLPVRDGSAVSAGKAQH
jgi:lipopolysaccharide transport system ATP-binding protein